VKGLTLYEEYNIDSPYTDCRRHNNLIPLPNSNSGSLGECLIRGDFLGAEVWMKTYIRSTINSDEAATEKKEEV
jgi:hypothetical protein